MFPGFYIPCTIYRWRSVWSDTRIKQYWPKIFNKIIYVTKRNMWDNWWNRCFQKHKKSISNSIIFLHLALRILKTWPIEGIKTIAKKTKGNGKIIKIPRGGRRRSVDLSAPTILQPSWFKSQAHHRYFWMEPIPVIGMRKELK